jgi:hypothetical protein
MNKMTNAIARFLRRLGMVFRRDRFRSDLEEEMAFHRAEAEKALVAGEKRSWMRGWMLLSKGHEFVPQEAFTIGTVDESLMESLDGTLNHSHPIMDVHES